MWAGSSARGIHQIATQSRKFSLRGGRRQVLFLDLGSASRQIALLASGLKFVKIPLAWRPAPNIVDLGLGLRHAESRLFGPGFAKISPVGRPAPTIVDLGLGLTLLARNS